jgi:NAD+--asparagine ADP-ribosyltransferase
MDNSILELRCNECVKLDKYQFIVSFNSLDNEKYSMTFPEEVQIGISIRLNSFYHTFQKLDDNFRISIKQFYLTKEMPSVLDLFLSDIYETKNKEKVSVYKDSNTLEIYKMIEMVDNLKLNSRRLLDLKNENLVIIKKPHVFNGNYIIENWIQPFPQK